MSENTLFFNTAARRLPIKKRVLHWAAQNHQFAFDVIVMGKGQGCLDQLIKERCKRDWIQKVYCAFDISEVVEHMKHSPWVLGFLTEDDTLVGVSENIFKFTGHKMKLKDLAIEGAV